jgi:hypothetical protein
MELHRPTTLPNGLRVRLRLPGPSDRARLRDLLDRVGVPGDEFSLSRMTRFDPRTRTAVCATCFALAGETVVGYAAIDRWADEPDLVLADEDLAPGVGELLTAAARRHGARRVA